MGLSRALLYAGAKSTVHSLWSISDKETEVLMRYFYLELREGTAKDEALRRAKLKFIQDHPLKTHPFFWAGFVVSGNPQPMLVRPNYAGMGMLMLMALGFLSLGYLGYRKRFLKPKQG
jgi:hypothetical protein